VNVTPAISIRLAHAPRRNWSNRLTGIGVQFSSDQLPIPASARSAPPCVRRRAHKGAS
jgi:hypothetical protein